jgi:uncharacterized protein YlxP (DUF503 family)
LFTLSAKLTFYIPQSTSLKDKRQIRRNLIEKARHKFNLAIAEIDTQDVHQTLTIGIAVDGLPRTFQPVPARSRGRFGAGR